MRGGEFVENLVTDNHIEFSHRWFKLANFEEFINDMDEYYQNLTRLGQYSKMESNWMCPIVPTTGMIQPVKFIGKQVYNPIIFYNDRNKEITYESLMKGN